MRGAKTRVLLLAPLLASAAAALVGCMAEGAYYEPDHEYAGRFYYYEPWYPDEVYFYDEGRPEFIDHRRVFHDHDRSYYMEKDRRVYYDHESARSHRPPAGARRR